MLDGIFYPVLFLLPSERVLLEVVFFKYVVPVLFLLPSYFGVFHRESFFFRTVTLVGSMFDSFVVDPRFPRTDWDVDMILS